jgi:succinyl-diaminopimelate desuccinylase
LKKYIDSKKDEILEELKNVIAFKSVSERENVEGAPFGEECKRALDYVLELGNRLGFRTKNLDGYAGYIEFGEGDEMVGIIGHLDVVPANFEDGWNSRPFNAEIRDNKLYGRGTIDDKGPVIASLYAMKAVAEKMKINRRVRLILGVNEEKNWECINYYKQNEEAPTIGFSPDADFPCIYAEKGIITVIITHDFNIDGAEILEVSCGDNAINVVPKYCMVRLKLNNPDDIQKYQNRDGVYVEKIRNDTIKLVAEGKASHAAHPTDGDNAITKMLLYLKDNWYVNQLKNVRIF